MGSSKNNSSQCFSRKVKWRCFGGVLAQSWRYFGVIFKKNGFIMVLSNDYINGNTFQIVPEQAFNCFVCFQRLTILTMGSLLLSVGKCEIR